MRGLSNHHVISDCKYLGEAHTIEKFGLYVGSFPFVNSKQSHSVIHGELYEVETAEQLERLDALEGHPDYYTRSDCKVQLTGQVDIIEAQIYFNDKDSMAASDAEHVNSGIFKDSAFIGRYIGQES